VILFGLVRLTGCFQKVTEKKNRDCLIIDPGRTVCISLSKL
jgi:hypothetical protein